MAAIEDREAWGGRLRRRRTELGWSLADVAERTQLSRAYISAIERGRSKRPGSDVVRRLEAVLGLEVPAESRPDTPPTLASVAEEHGLTPAEVASLAALRIRGRQPQTRQRWDFIYKALLASETLDSQPRTYQREAKPEDDGTRLPK
jgi:transcriptional regulator with XRE-family HTH domain